MTVDGIFLHGDGVLRRFTQIRLEINLEGINSSRRLYKLYLGKMLLREVQRDRIKLLKKLRQQHSNTCIDIKASLCPSVLI